MVCHPDFFFPPSCWKYCLLEAHGWDLTTTLGIAPDQRKLHCPRLPAFPQGQPISNAWTISGYKAQHPCSIWRHLWKALPAPDLCRIIWDSRCNLIPVQCSLCPALLSSLPYRHCSLENSPLSPLHVICCLKVFSLENWNLRLNGILYGLHSTILLQRSYRKRSILRWISQ